MIAYYVATGSHFVLVKARNESEAREFGEIALRKFYLDEQIRISLVRKASEHEIQNWDWHIEITEAETVRS